MAGVEEEARRRRPGSQRTRGEPTHTLLLLPPPAVGEGIYQGRRSEQVNDAARLDGCWTHALPKRLWGEWGDGGWHGDTIIAFISGGVLQEDPNQLTWGSQL